MTITLDYLLRYGGTFGVLMAFGVVLGLFIVFAILLELYVGLRIRRDRRTRGDRDTVDENIKLRSENRELSIELKHYKAIASDYGATLSFIHSNAAKANARQLPEPGE